MIDKKTLTRASALIGEATAFVESVRDEATNKYEEKSDTWKESEAGQTMDDKIAALNEAIEALEGAQDNIDTASA
jgi:hypothetical protein